ncbi:radical SAM protein, partial [Escherichia coli]|nr:radical SAM protein [Escherichia coli]
INGTIRPLNYGKITSIALDPIEKKPLSMYMPGSLILSVGSYGCNLRCPFCQNYDISWSDYAYKLEEDARFMSPEELAGMARMYKNQGNIGVAFTYNEPLIGYEYVRDTARLVHDRGMKNVLVTNGM